MQAALNVIRAESLESASLITAAKKLLEVQRSHGELEAIIDGAIDAFALLLNDLEQERRKAR
jgi:hypothetical protein